MGTLTNAGESCRDVLIGPCNQQRVSKLQARCKMVADSQVVDLVFNGKCSFERNARSYHVKVMIKVGREILEGLRAQTRIRALALTRVLGSSL